MKYSAKLKSDSSAMIIFSVVCVAILIASRVIFGEKGFHNVLWVIASVFAILHFIVLLRTRNWGHSIAMLFYLFLASTFLTLSFYPHRLLTPFFAAGGLVLFVPFMYVLITNRIRWRQWEILELAARPVNETDDGFTPRPFPAGEAKYTRQEIIGLAKFMLKHVIIFPHFEQNRTVFVVPENMFKHLLFLRRGYENDTYVSFDFDGNVSVSITRRDYQKYREELTFDQLCDSLGNLFKQFLELYQDGQKDKIIDRLNTLRLKS